MKGIFRSEWLAVPILIIGMVALFTSYHPNVEQQLLYVLWDLGHVAFFCVWSFWLYHHSPTWIRPNFVTHLLNIAIICFSASVAIESIQPLFNRNFSWQDIWNNCAGTSLGLCFAIKTNRMASIPSLTRIPLFIYGLYTLWPIGMIISTQSLQYWQFPTLSNPSWHIERESWHSNARFIKNAHPAESNIDTFLLTPSGSKQTTRAVLRYFPADWSNYQQLNAQVYYSSQQQQPMTIYISDHSYRKKQFKRHFRHESYIVLQPGHNLIQLPINKLTTYRSNIPVNMQSIDRIGFAIRNWPLTETSKLYFEKIWLSNDDSETVTSLTK